MAQRNDLPTVTAPNFTQRVRETLMVYLGRQGDPLDRGVTVRDLVEGGIAVLPGNGGSGVSGSGVAPLLPAPPAEPEPDLTPPPAPTGFRVTPSISHIFIEHDVPRYAQGSGHLRTHVYAANVEEGGALPTFDAASEVGQFAGRVWALPVNPSTTLRLWIKWESQDGVLSVSPAGGTNGQGATTGRDVAALEAALTGPGNPFKVVTQQFTLPDGTVVPPGTYTADAFIHNAQIANAMIANLAVDDAKIANLSASKLVAGSIEVGQYIESTGFAPGSTGWRINGDGTAEFSGVVVRGTILAGAGTIGGWNIGSNFLQSTTYAAGEFGTRLNSDGTGQIGGISIYAQGLGAGSTAYNTGNGAWIGRDGKFSLRHSSGSIVTFDGSGVFRAQNADASRLLDLGATGSESALKVGAALDIKADGTATFGGTLTAAAIEAVNTINIAGEAVTVPRFASAESTITLNTTSWASALTTAPMTLPAGNPGTVVVLITLEQVAGSAYGTNEGGQYSTAYANQMRLLRQASGGAPGSGTVILTRTLALDSSPFTQTLKDEPGSGSWQYELQGLSGIDAAPTSQDAGTLGYRTLFVLGAKR